VQGQFNQGGTGALRFCGKHNLQLVVSRRNQALVKDADLTPETKNGALLSFERERPAGKRRNSVLTYLAPMGLDAGKSDFKGDVHVLPRRFIRPISLVATGPYSRKASYGTAIKLYEYKYLGENRTSCAGAAYSAVSTCFCRRLLCRYACSNTVRTKKVNSSSRKPRNYPAWPPQAAGRQRNNVEAGFPVSIPFSPHGEKLVAHIFAFKPEGTAREEEDDDDDGDKPKKKLGGILRYRKQEGVLFVRNGQTHGSLSKGFFRNNSIKMKPLADDILVFVDLRRAEQ